MNDLPDLPLLCGLHVSWMSEGNPRKRVEVVLMYQRGQACLHQMKLINWHLFPLSPIFQLTNLFPVIKCS